MSSFTEALTVTKIGRRIWEVEKAFKYHIGEEESEEYVEVKKGFRTDFASIPRIFWILFPPDGQYTQAAVVHDYTYFKHMFTREKCDQIFYEAMGVLGVAKWKRIIMYQAVRRFAWYGWNKHNKK